MHRVEHHCLPGVGAGVRRDEHLRRLPHERSLQRHRAGLQHGDQRLRSVRE
jgi:hypothetical protein